MSKNKIKFWIVKAICLAVCLLKSDSIESKTARYKNTSNKAQAIVMIVNSSNDDSDLDLNDGICITQSGFCTLRAAIEQINFGSPASIIHFGVSSVILRDILPAITRSVVIEGGIGYPTLINGEFAGDGSGLYIIASNSFISGLAIGGFSNTGLVLGGSSNIVENCYFGTTSSGTTRKSNGIGIAVVGGNNIIQKNVISGNYGSGLYLQNGTIGNIVDQNLIGTDISGMVAIPNGQGIAVDGGYNTLIRNNIVSGNTATGIYLYGGAVNNSIIGNLIGVSKNGTSRLGNGQQGIHLSGSGTSNNHIGQSSAEAKNIISGNGFSGVAISENANNNYVEGNFIGTSQNAETPISNDQFGVFIDGNSSNNIIGGLTGNSGNIIAYNGEDGVRIGSGLKNAILSNQIYENNKAGITLTPGANNGILPPTICLKRNGNGLTVIEYQVIGLPSMTYTLQVYSNSVCDSSGSGEGKTVYLTKTVTTDSNGIGNATVDFPSGQDKVVTATITDTVNNTSSFSNCINTDSPTAELMWYEVTQGLQNQQNDVDLIEGRRTYVRVHVKSLTSSQTVNGMLYGKKNGLDLPGSPLLPVNHISHNGQTVPLTSIRITNNPKRKEINDSFLFQLPTDWIKDKIVLDFRLQNISTLLVSENTECVQEVPFLQKKILSLTAVAMPINAPTIDGGNYKYDVTYDELQGVKQTFLAYLPYTEVNYNAIRRLTPITGIPFDNNEFSKLLDAFWQLYGKDDGIHLGIFPRAATPSNSSLSTFLGLAFFGGKFGIGYNTDSVLPHELGHIIGLKHTAYIGSEDNINVTHIPKDGHISEDVTDSGYFGFNIYNRSILDPKTPDLMSWASNTWPSQTTWKSFLLSKYLSLGTERQSQVTNGPKMFISGSVSVDKYEGAISSIFVYNGSTSNPLQDFGEYTIKLEDNLGNNLGVYSVTPLSVNYSTQSGSQDRLLFLTILPWSSNVKKVMLMRNGQVLSTRLASNNSPVIGLQYPNGGETLTEGELTIKWTASDPDGDALTYIVQYSKDGGSTWENLVVNHKASSFTASLDALSGTNRGLIKVLASDGFYTAEVVSASVFNVSNHAPKAFIASLDDNVTYLAKQMIILEGEGYDIEDGSLIGNSLIWSSDKKGILGSGKSLVINASNIGVGTHKITLTAIDSNSSTATVTKTINVSQNQPIIPEALTVGPKSLYFRTAGPAKQVESQIVPIRSYGNQDQNWVATTDKNWIVLSASSGVGSKDLTVTINQSSLGSGVYTGKITIAPTNVNLSTQIIDVDFNANADCNLTSIMPSALPSGSVGVLYNQKLTQSGGLSPVVYSVIGELPIGLTFTESVLSGTPTFAGTYMITIKAVDANGCSSEKTYSLLVDSLSITATNGIPRTIGAAALNSTIATVSHPIIPAGNLLVKVTSANPTGGVAISNIVNTNGVISANILAACTATIGTVSFTLQVSNGSETSSDTLTVAITANPTPVLNYIPASVNVGSSVTISPSNGPSDNVTVSSIVLQSKGGYTGSVAVYSSGLVTLSNAAPVGVHNITIRATDNCGATTDATIYITVKNADSSWPIIGSSPSIGTPSGGVIGPGSLVTITQTLTNNSSTSLMTVYIATLPLGLSVLSCSGSIGSCMTGNETQVLQYRGLDNPRIRNSANDVSASQIVTWSGTIPGNGSVTISYQVQVSTQIIGGNQYCINTTINGVVGVPTCLTLTAAPVGPGTPIVLGPAAAQKPGSVLIYNIYTSGVNTNVNDSQISITNISPNQRTYVHLFFVDGSNCSVADMTINLTQNQTMSFFMSDIDPEVTGYLIAVVTDENGCPATQNYLIGEGLVKFESGHQAILPAIGVAGLGVGTVTCDHNSIIKKLFFDGLNYDILPRTLAINSLPSIANPYSSLLVVNRIGGDLRNEAGRLGTLFGYLYNDRESSHSFMLMGNVCQLRGVLGNNFPRTVPRLSAIIPAGRSGWLKIWTNEDQAVTGAVIQIGEYGGGHNLHYLTTTDSETLTIPVYPAF